MKALLLTLLLPFPALAAPGPDRVAVLKAEITAIATANQLRQDNLPAVRGQLQPLVDELVGLVPPRTEAEKLGQVAGGWRSLWSDMRFGPFVDLANVYQVVFADGYYYNVSRTTPPGGEATGYLRGAFADAGDHLAIEFTRSAAVSGWLGAGADLAGAAKAVESGEVAVEDQPGPVGVRGDLQNTFVDDELRVVTGKSAEDAASSLFILVRAAATVD